MRPLFFVLGAAPEKDIFRKAGQGTLRYGTGFVYEVGGAGFGAAGAKGPAAARTGGGVPPPSAPPHRFLVKTGASGSGNLRKGSIGQRKQKSVRILCLSFLQRAGVAMATKMKERMIYNETRKRI